MDGAAALSPYFKFIFKKLICIFYYFTCKILSEELQLAKEKNDVKLQQLERQASIEKQQVYEDAFLEQMNYYIQHGKTEGIQLLCHRNVLLIGKNQCCIAFLHITSI